MRLCGFDVGLAHPLFLIAGPCVVESLQLQIDVAGQLKEICAALRVPFVFKSSYDQHGNGDAELMIWAGSTFKQGLGRITFYSRNDSNFTQVRRFNQEAGDPVILGKVDVLETDFGTGIVRLSQFINTGGDNTSAASKRLAYLCPMDYVEARFSQNPISIPLAKTGRNEKFLVTATAALAVTNPLPFGKWAPSA